MNKNTRNTIIAALAVALAGVGFMYYRIKPAEANSGGGSNSSAGGNNSDDLSGGNNGGGDSHGDGDGLDDNPTGENNGGGTTPVIPTYNPIISVTPASYNAQEDGTLTITGDGFPPNSVAFGLVNGSASFSGGLSNPYKTDANGNLNPITRTVSGTALGQNSLVVKTAATTSQTPVTSTSNTIYFTVWNNSTGDPDNPQITEPAPTPRNGTGYDIQSVTTFPNVDISGAIDTPPKQIAKAESNMLLYSNTYYDRIAYLNQLWNVRRNLYKILLARVISANSATYDEVMEAYDKLNPQVVSASKPRGANSGNKDYYNQPIIVGVPFVTHMWNGSSKGGAAWYVQLPDEKPYAFIPQWDLPSTYVTIGTIKAAEFESFGT